MKINDINNAVLIWGVISREGLAKLKAEGKLVIVPESRPDWTGLKYNAPFLRRENVKFVYCVDNVLGLLFYKRKINKTFIFYKEVNEKGFTGICGSLYVWLLSKLHKVAVETMPQGRGAAGVCNKDKILFREGEVFKDIDRFVMKAGDEIFGEEERHREF